MPWRSIFTISTGHSNSGMPYHLFGYPESAMYDLVVDGRAVLRPDLVYSEGHVRRRLTDVPLEVIKGAMFLELSQVAGADFSGSPVLYRAPIGSLWRLIAFYVGEKLNSDGVRVGYAVRLEELRDWEPEVLECSILRRPMLLNHRHLMPRRPPGRRSVTESLRRLKAQVCRPPHLADG